MGSAFRIMDFTRFCQKRCSAAVADRFGRVAAVFVAFTEGDLEAAYLLLYSPPSYWR